MKFFFESDIGEFIDTRTFDLNSLPSGACEHIDSDGVAHWGAWYPMESDLSDEYQFVD